MKYNDIIKLSKNSKILRLYKKNCVPICFASDDNYVAQTAVMIQSIIANSIMENNYDIIIICSGGIEDVNAKNILALNNKENVSIRFFDIKEIETDVTFFTESKYTQTKYTKEAYFRLFIPHLMTDYEKVIYFDGDMVAINDVSPLIYTDLGECLIGATRDYSGIAACYDKNSDRKKYRQQIGLTDIDNYFISSLLIFNINLFNSRYNLENIKKIISSFCWRQHDQDILNVLCKNSIVWLDAGWSYFDEMDYTLHFLPSLLKKELLSGKKDLHVIHFAAEKKAWKDTVSDLNYWFWFYAKQTNFFDVFNGLIQDNAIAYRNWIFNYIFKAPTYYYYVYDNIILTSPPYFVGKIGDLKIVIEFFQIQNEVAYIEGYYETLDILPDLRLFITLNGDVLKTYNSTEYRKYGIRSVTPVKNFKVKLNLTDNNLIGFGFTNDFLHFAKPSYVSVEQFAPINEHSKSFYHCSRWILTRNNNIEFVIEKSNFKKKLWYNHLLCKDISKRKDKYFKSLSKIRWLYILLKPLMKNQIWLISDKNNNLNEDLLNFYMFLKNLKGIKPFIVLDKENLSAKPLKNVNNRNVLHVKSLKHKLLYVFSDKIVSSTYNMDFFLPCFDRVNEVRDMLADKEFIFWQNDIEDTSFMVRPWYNVKKFILNNESTFKYMNENEIGYDSSAFLLKKENIKTLKDYQQIYSFIIGENNECK